MAEKLLEIQDLKKYFPKRGGTLGRARLQVYAVDGVTLTVEEGECLGVVGESGCGKTTLGRCVIGLEKPTGGTIRHRGVDIAGLSGRRMKEFRSKIQVVFQDPYASLNPRWLVKDIIAEPSVVKDPRTRAQVRGMVAAPPAVARFGEATMHRL